MNRENILNARNSVLVLGLFAAVIVAGNQLVDRSGNPDRAGAAPPRAGVVSSESSTLTIFNLAAEARRLKIEEDTRASEKEGEHFAEVTARELEAVRHGQQPVALVGQAAGKPLEDFSRLPGPVSRKTLESIAACESGGDPKVISSNGLYHGKYQFSRDTWESVGGKGLPSDAAEAEQDYRAALLYKRSGPGQWPVCGR